jgi:hypothetical protein
LLVGATASCTAAATAAPRSAGSPSATAPADSTAASPGFNASLSIASSPGSSASPASSTSPKRTSATSPVPTPPTGPLATAFPPAPSLPSGNWTGIHWTKFKGQASIWTPAPDGDFNEATGVEHDYSDWKVFGWSRGYIAFADATTIDDSGFTEVMSTENSSDGIHWQAGGQFTLSGGPDDDPPDFNSDGVGALVEGPAGLIAVYTGEPDCGWGTYAYPLGTSADGIHWQPAYVDLDSQTIEAGAAGYIATGKKGVSTSSDGKTWKAADLTGTAFTGLVGLEDGTSFAGGFVISGEANLPAEGCQSDMIFKTPSLWWSPDGTTWTRDQVPDVAGPSGLMYVWRVNDQTLIAEQANDAGAIVRQWMSSDGRSWKSMPVSSVDLRPGPWNEAETIGGRTLLLAGAYLDTSAIYALGADLKLTKLTETGELPVYGDNDAVFGPAGIIVAGDDGNTYVGLPVAG